MPKTALPHDKKTIAAPATAPGGAIAVIRVSGPQSIAATDAIFTPVPLAGAAARTVHFGRIKDRAADEVIDEVLVTLFRAPNSYTGEDVVEIACHGSLFVVSAILRLLFAQGVEQASPGEFTRRAFLNGKMDLTQAEAVADLIASENAAAHRVAIQQMRGGYAAELAALRDKLLHISSLLELELDFSEEDVEFADRRTLLGLIGEITERCTTLSDSFRLGNVIKNGVPVAIVGAPNVGKSTLLNALVGEERAIVSDIAGTTRDTIEETLIIDGITFRFVDTAGLRHTSDTIEAMGIERTRERIVRAAVVLFLVGEPCSATDLTARITALGLSEEQQLIVLFNKQDVWDASPLRVGLDGAGITALMISARSSSGISELQQRLVDTVGIDGLFSGGSAAVVVTNARHYEALRHAEDALARASSALDSGLPADLVAEELRAVLHFLGEITGEITTDDILANVFSKFCIGK